MRITGTRSRVNLTQSSGFRISGPLCAALRRSVRRLAARARIRAPIRTPIRTGNALRRHRPLSAISPEITHRRPLFWCDLGGDLDGVGPALRQPIRERWDLWRLVNVCNALRRLPCQE